MLMTKLTSSDIEHVASLAKLPLKKNEEEKYKIQLTQILNHIEDLKEVDTTGVEPTSQTTGLTDIAREDEVNPLGSLKEEQALSGSDNTYNNCFIADRLINK